MLMRRLRMSLLSIVWCLSLLHCSWCLGDGGPTTGSGFPSLPRFTLAQVLARPELREGHIPFVITDAAKDWQLIELLSGGTFDEFLLDRFPDSIIDFWPRNLHNFDKRSPWLERADSLFGRDGLFHGSPPSDWVDVRERAKYAMWRTTEEEWVKLRELMEPMPSWLEPEVVWRKACFGSSDAAWANLHAALRWKILIVGVQNSSMFFHPDDFASSTVHVQLRGRKRWTVCAPSPTLRKGDRRVHGLNTFDPSNFLDESRRRWIRGNIPGFNAAECTDTVLHPGETIYYPTFWWHHTLNLDPLNVGFAGRRFDGTNFRLVLRQITQTCIREQKDITQQHPGAAPVLGHELCRIVQGACKRVWEAMPWDRLFGAKRSNSADHRLCFGCAPPSAIDGPDGYTLLGIDVLSEGTHGCAAGSLEIRI